MKPKLFITQENQGDQSSGNEARPDLVLSLSVTFKPCEHTHLRQLEWEGLFRKDRQVIARAFRRQEEGKNLMLLAIANNAPIGQVWIDLQKAKKQRAVVLWAIRVVPWMQGLGIGRRLLVQAERICARQGFEFMRLIVAQKNQIACRLYEQCGFRVTEELQERERYKTKAGRVVWLKHSCFLMEKSLMPAPALLGAPPPRTPPRVIAV